MHSRMSLEEARRAYDNAYNIIKSWRYRAETEKTDQSLVRKRRRSLDPDTYMDVERPFFKSIDSNDDTYIRIYRIMIYGLMKYSLPIKIVVMRSAGYNLGKMLVEKGLIKSIDDMPHVFIQHKIGLLDIIDESSNRMRVNIYECMSCFQMNYIGTPMCDFEAGILEGILEKLIGRNVVKENYCWGLGYSFCGFEIYFE